MKKRRKIQFQAYRLLGSSESTFMRMTMRLFLRFFVTCFLVLHKSSVEAAQTESFIVYTSIIAKFSETEITSRVRNDNISSEEIEFEVILPREAFISGFSMAISGKTYTATVEEKEEARERFEEAKLQGATAGLVATRDRSTRTFKTSVNIEAGATVIFKITFQQLLREIRGRYRNQMILLGSQLTDYLTIRVDICEQEEIRNVEVVPVLDSQGQRVTVKTAMDRRGNSARVDYLRGQNADVITALSSTGGSFVVEYELANTPNEGQGILGDRTAGSIRIIFTLDISGSMDGTKLTQVQEAMRNIISRLSPEDRFGIVVFNSDARAWQGGRILFAATEDNVKSAHNFISSLSAVGSTNIDEALRLSIDIFNNDVGNVNTVDPVSNYIVFLTDGLPTEGETNLAILQNKIFARNTKRIPIHVVGFGRNVDADFLEQMAARNNGTWTQIFENINAALQIQNFLNELAAAAVPAGGIVQRRGDFSLTDQQRLFCNRIDSDIMKLFGGKALALASVTEILRQYAATNLPAEKQRLKKEAIDLSKKAGLVTLVTSLLVIKPKNEVKKRVRRDVGYEPQKRTTQIRVRSTRNDFCSAKGTNTKTCYIPDHFLLSSRFVVRLSNNVDTCFHWTGYSGEVYNLLHDQGRSIVVNAAVKGTQEKKHGAPYRIFATKLLVALHQDNIIITVDDKEVRVKNTSSNQASLHLPLTDISDYETSYGPVRFAIYDVSPAHAILNISVRNEVRFLVIIHHPDSYHSKDFIHMDVMMLTDEMLSTQVEGVYSLFPRNLFQNDESTRIKKTTGKNFLHFRDRVVPTRQISATVPYLKKTLTCWQIADPGKVFHSTLSKFKVRGLYDIPYAM